MAEGVRAELTGDKELLATLQQLPEKLMTRVILGAMRKGAKLIVMEAQARAPKNSGLLIEAQGVKQKNYRGRGVGQDTTAVVIIGTRRGMGKEVEHTDKRPDRTVTKTEYEDPTKIDHLIEFGTWKDPAQPFMRPAYDIQIGGAQAMITNEIAVGVERQLAKL